MDPPSILKPSALFGACGLVVVITGGGTGIGRAMAAALFHAGASRVYLLGRRVGVLETAAAAIEPTSGGRGEVAGKTEGQAGGDGRSGGEAKVIVPLECDVRSKASVHAAAEEVRRRDGRVDVLVNNAGVSGPDDRALHTTGLDDPGVGVAAVQDVLLQNLDGDGWANTFAINSTAVMLVSAAFLPLLEAGNAARGWSPGRVGRGGGLAGQRQQQDPTNPPPTRKRTPVAGVDADDDRLAQIVTVASIAAFNRYVTAGFAYSASKAAAVHLGKSMAHMLAPWGIRSNVICPGCKCYALPAA
jgi:THO complex subunit 3